MRDALMVTILPGSATTSVAFWEEFDATAPAHLKLGLAVSLFALGVVSPFFCGYFRTLKSLDEDARERVIVRAASLPVLSEIVEIAKVVACLRAFSNTPLEEQMRGRK